MRALLDIALLFRPWQWLKNLFVFSAPFFAGALWDGSNFQKILVVFLLFCLVSSSVYVFNDIQDVERDRRHPVKKNRPLAAGRLKISVAWGLFVIMAAGGMTGAVIMGGPLPLILGVYLVLNVAYSIYLKKAPILDVLCISVGFILRVLAGGMFLDVFISQWLLVCTLTLSLFLAFGKRRQELAAVGETAVNKNDHPLIYTMGFLDHAITISATMTALTYLLYIVEGRPSQFAWGREAFYTCFFVLYGIFRYLALVHNKKAGEDLVVLLLRDRPLLLTSIGWALSWLLLLYMN